MPPIRGPTTFLEWHMRPEQMRGCLSDSQPHSLITCVEAGSVASTRAGWKKHFQTRSILGKSEFTENKAQS